ncbi:MAG: AzlC family ABC transporter permease [Acidimicrobiales bacterium]
MQQGSGVSVQTIDAQAAPVADSRPMSLALRDVAPLALPVVPFGLAIGATVAESDLAASGSLAGAVLVLAGGAQLAVIGVLDSGSSVAVAVGTALLINLRFVLYSAGLARWFAAEPLWRRMLLAVPLVDQQFLLGQRRFDESTTTAWRRSYYLTVSAVLFLSFVVGQGVGYRLGTSLPPSVGLEMAAPLAFAGMLGLATRGRSSMTAAGVAGLVVVVVAGLPGGLALPVAAIAGMAAGSAVPVRSEES